MPKPSKGPRKSFLLRMPTRTHDRVQQFSRRKGWTYTDTLVQAIDKGMEQLDDPGHGPQG